VAIRVYVFVDAFDKDDGWGWYPTALGGTPMRADIKPGESVNGLTWLAKEKNWQVHGRRMRIWAESVDGKLVWNGAKNEDVWLCPKLGYLSRNKAYYTYTFK
ncbi:MAG: hypothetical protein AB7K24_21005, partial [Gemmataceae bacterium]